MIYVPSWTTKKHWNILSRRLNSKLRKVQELFKDLHRNSFHIFLRSFLFTRTFQDCASQAPLWNELQPALKLSESVTGFKRRLRWLPLDVSFSLLYFLFLAFSVCLCFFFNYHCNIDFEMPCGDKPIKCMYALRHLSHACKITRDSRDYSLFWSLT